MIKFRALSIALIFCLILSVFATVSTVDAQDPFLSPDMDGDGLSNDLETSGWYNLAGGPFVTDPRDVDSDNDGLTDSEEKLFDTDPLDSHDPGMALKYDSSFNTKEYFSATDPKYISMKQGGDQYLMTEAFVVRRGTTINIDGPASGTLDITGTSMTALTPEPDPANGGWTVSLPVNGTVGTYTATVTDGTWIKSLPVYVIFELPTSLPQDQINAFLYDDDPANKRDEVAVWWRMGEWPYYKTANNTNPQPCPETDPNASCSLWQYHLAYGYAQAYWTEQFTKSAFIDHAIKAIHGKTSQADAAPAIATWTDYEFRSRSGRIQNNWTSSMYRWFDGTGITMSGGYCETTSTTFTTILRSAGIAARPFTLDYNKTTGHGESGQINTQYEYDHSVMMWLDNTWKAQRSFGGNEVNDLYYPWPSGTSNVVLLSNWGKQYRYSDYYGDAVVSMNEDWTFETAPGVGTVNTAWEGGIPSSEFVAANRDYTYDTKKPLQITQSPQVDILNCQLWKGDNWAPSEWQSPPISNPADRGATLTYILPSGIPDPANPLENFPYNPQPTACSSATSTAECNAFKAAWTTVCTPVQGQASTLSSNILASLVPGFISANESNISTVANSTNSGSSKFQDVAPQLLNILDDYGRDRDGDGRYDELIIKFEVTSPVAGKYQFGGWLRVGDTDYSLGPTYIELIQGKQAVEINFDGQQIGDKSVNGPYKVEALWAALPDQAILDVVEPDQMLDYQEYKYSTKAFKANQFKVTAAVFANNFSHQGIDKDRNGFYETVLVRTPLKISFPGQFRVEGDLYDGYGNYVDHASWTGNNASAELEFNIRKTMQPYSVQHLMLTIANGEFLDSRYAPVHEVTDLADKIEGSTVLFDMMVDTKNPFEIGIQKVVVVNPNPGSFTITPVDTNGNGKYDKLVVDVGVDLTEAGDTGDYQIEALLEDEYGKEVAWTVSGAKHLIYGVTGQKMQLEFDGKMLYDQLPLTGSRALKLVAVKIFSGNLSSATFESEVKYAVTMPTFTRSQFEPSSLAVTLFQDDLESGTGKWISSSQWSLDSSIWNSWNHAWKASTTSNSGAISLASPLNLSDYTGPVLRFNNAYRLGTANGMLQVSRDGTNWITVATYTGSTQHWKTEQIDLSAYGRTANLQLRFNIPSINGLVWYVDDVYLSAWPSVGNEYTLTVDVGAGGTVTKNPDQMYYADNSAVTLTANANPGYTFSGWGGDLFGSINPTTITMDSSKNVMASFTQNTYTLSVDVVGSGTVTKEPDLPTYAYGTEVTLIPTPAEGWSFSSWGGACTGRLACVVTVDGNKSVTATFLHGPYSLMVTTVGSGNVSIDPPGPYYSGNVVHLTATADLGWSFAGWSGDVNSTSNPFTITMDSNKYVSATFEYHYSLRESFNRLSDWAIKGSPRGYSAVLDQVNYKEGTESIKLTNPRNGYVQITKDVNWTLTGLEQGSFQFWVYSYGTKPTSGSIVLSNDKAYKNYFITDTFTDNFSQGWNLITLTPGNWKIGAGSPNWNNPITGLRITIYGGAVQNSYSFDQLISGTMPVP